MARAALLLAGLGVVAALAACRPQAGFPDGCTSLTYAAEGDVSRERMDRAMEVLSRRVHEAQVPGVVVTRTAAHEIVVDVPSHAADAVASVRSLVELDGRLEFRIRADSETEARERERRDATPPDLYATMLEDARWVPWDPSDPTSRVKEILVLTPERPAERRWRELLAAKGPQAPETIQARRDHDDVVRSEVFLGEDIDDARLSAMGPEVVVAFEFAAERKRDFESFTTRNVKRELALVRDGVVMAAPVINSPLPGSGIIEGAGAGFTRAEAEAFRIRLVSGSLGVRLRLVREETVGGDGDEDGDDGGEVHAADATSGAGR